MENKREENEIKSENSENTTYEVDNNKIRRKRAISKTFEILKSVISKVVTVLIILISITIVVQKVTNNKEAFFGYRIFRVQTGSMIPKYNIGDVILVKAKNINDIKIGDDVTYNGNAGSVKGLLVTHRVIDIEEENGEKIFHTKGIANNLEDPTIKGEQIDGVVVTKMYILSFICLILNNKYIFYFCGIVPLTIYVGFRLFKSRNNERIERKN